MNKSSVLDYIVVGQGLAGSAVALQLMRLDKTFVVIDKPSKNTASHVAAGLFNPITGKNLAKTWMADVIFPYLHRFYREAEDLTGKKFFHPMPLYRPFVSIEQQNEWMGRSTDKAYENIVEKVTTSPSLEDVHDPYGGVLVKQSGYINTIEYGTAVRTLLSRKGSLIEDLFCPDKLYIADNHVVYDGLEAHTIIFCEGCRISDNPWFKGLPVGFLKGETLTIKCRWQKHVILNRGVYIVPGNGSDEWRVGATYNLADKTPGTTDRGRVELQEKLGDLTRLPYEIIDHNWGMRPTSPDHRPMLGKHPKFSSLAVFNGLGTKGVSLAPYFSEVLIHWLENKGTISKQVDVSRYKLLY